ncbi:hypothetical protein FB451DRAFT_1275014 [Mycena latifolia]|nr:hypothetical protein FB451DRAFT_1275014 [Mycena latifolia]
MEGHASPLEIQELLEACIWPLRRSSPDMRSCALVAHRWRHAAQSHLFREISLESRGSGPPKSLGPRLLAVLHSSPHLIRHIAWLDLGLLQGTTETFLALCDVQFTHVEHISVRLYGVLSLGTAHALQQLLSASSLRRVTLLSSFAHLPLFAHVWRKCVPGVRHLELTLARRQDVDLDTTDLAQLETTPGAPIVLESLRLGWLGDFQDWLTDPLWPFDFSALKVFSRPWNMSTPWQAMAPAFRAIEVLDVALLVRRSANSRTSTYVAHSSQTDDNIDLAWFPALLILRIQLVTLRELSVAIPTLSSLSPANCLRRIILSFPHSDTGVEVCASLAPALSSLPVHPPTALELEMDAADYTRATPYFHEWIGAKNTICWSDQSPKFGSKSWFQNNYMAMYHSP